jgi:hypothetical protein
MVVIRIGLWATAHPPIIHALFINYMIVKNKPYYNPIEYLYLDQKRKLELVKRIQKQITKFELTKENFEFVTN